MAPKSVGAGETMNVTCEVRSAGIKKTGAIEVTCTFGSASVSATVSDSLMNGQSAVVVFPAITAPTAGGVNNLVISAEETGVTDAVINDNEVRKSLRVYSETVERNCLLIEQFTGQTCPNCPAGSKQMATAMKNLKVEEKAFVVLAASDEKVQKSARNLENVKTGSVNTINVYDLLKYKKLVLTVDTIKKLEEVYA